MSSGGSSVGTAPELVIGRKTSLKDIVAALAQRGCADLTKSINSRACTKLPVAGGGFCDVFRGELKNGAKVAIKTLRIYDKPGQGDERQKILKRAAKEIYYWSRLSHPNVLELKGLAIFNGHMSMISKWMENGDMRSYVRLNPRVDRLSLCLGVSSGLCYIHTKGMVHGDLKAANVMVSRSGVPQITDFGNSQLRDATLNFTDTKSYSHSLRWTAPELLNTDDGPRATKEADVYAYGMTVLEVMTGEVPFQGSSDNQVIVLLLSNGEVPRPNTPVGSRMWRMLKRCWDQEATKRPTMASLKSQLQDLAISNYSDLIARHPHKSTHWMNRARVYASLREFAPALADCQMAAQLGLPSPTDETRLLTGLCHLGLGNAPACLAALRPLPSSMPHVSSLQQRARQMESNLQRFKDARRRGDWEGAHLALEQAVIALGADLPVKWGCWRAECDIARGSWISAQTAIRDALRLAPNSPKVLTLRGKVMFLTNQIPQAIQHAQQAIRVDRDYKPARHLLKRAKEVQELNNQSDVFSNVGMVKAAVERHSKALKMVGRRVKEGGGGHLRAALLSHRAAMRFKLKEFDPALKDTNASLALNPNSHEVLRTRARIHIKLERLEDAMRDFKAAQEFAASDGASWDELDSLAKETQEAEVMLNQGNSQDAHEILSTGSDQC